MVWWSWWLSASGWCCVPPCKPINTVCPSLDIIHVSWTLSTATLISPSSHKPEAVGHQVVPKADSQGNLTQEINSTYTMCVSSLACLCSLLFVLTFRAKSENRDWLAVAFFVVISGLGGSLWGFFQATSSTSPLGKKVLICSKSTIQTTEQRLDVVLMSPFLVLIRFHALLWCWLWTDKCPQFHDL